jgi:cyanophycin synthetase
MCGHQKCIRASCTGTTLEIATEIAADKDLTRKLLMEARLPVPHGILARSEAEAMKAAAELGCPVVVKPLDGDHGRGLNVGLMTAGEVRWASGLARDHSRTIIVEKHLDGNDHRLLVIGDKVIAVAERVPAHVAENGCSTISELTGLANQDPRRGEGHCSVLTRIAVDECVQHFLSGHGFSAESVPHMGQRVQLRPTANF